MEDRGKSHERSPRNSIISSPLLRFNNGDFPVSPNLAGISPFIQNQSLLNFISQNHPFQNSANQNRSFTSESNNFVSPTTLNHSQNQRSWSLYPMEYLDLSGDTPDINTARFGTDSFNVGSSSSSSPLLYGCLPSNNDPTFSHLQSGRFQNETMVANRNWGSSMNNISENLLSLQLPRTFTSIEDVRGRVVSAAKNEYGSLFLQRMLDEGKPEEIELILWELKDHLHKLMIDQYGNSLVQKVFVVCKMTSVLPFVIRDDHKLKNVCIHHIGVNVIQKLLEQLRTLEETMPVLWALKRITVTLAKNEIGELVIRHCLRIFPPAFTRPILEEVVRNFTDIATDSKGSTFVQKCLPVVNGEAMQLLVIQTTLRALILAEHHYGNYVLQYVVKMRMTRVNAEIVARLGGNYVQLSMNKFASNVLETLLAYSGESDVAKIVQEIMYSDEFLNVLQDPYGNFVVQKALKFTKRALQNDLKRRIQFHSRDLQSHPYGYRVLEFLKHRGHTAKA